MPAEPKTACRTPAKDRDGITNIPTWKFDTIRAAILESVSSAGPDGHSYKDLPDAVRSRLTKMDLERLGSVTWHVTCVKLEMEVRGELARLPGRGPQRIIAI